MPVAVKTLSLNPLQVRCKVGIITPILQVRTLRHIEMGLAQYQSELVYQPRPFFLSMRGKKETGNQLLSSKRRRNLFKKGNLFKNTN